MLPARKLIADACATFTVDSAAPVLPPTKLPSVIEPGDAVLPEDNVVVPVAVTTPVVLVILPALVTVKAAAVMLPRSCEELVLVPEIIVTA